MPARKSLIQDLPKPEFLKLYAETCAQLPQMNHFEIEVIVLMSLGFSQREIAGYFGTHHQKIGRLLQRMRRKIIAN